MKALVIGASGLVGRALGRVLESERIEKLGTFHTHPAPGLAPLDITDQGAVRALVSRYQPTVVFLSGALTAVDYCEHHVQECWRINVEGSRHVGQAAAEARAKLVFYSSEYVFDGTAGPYREDDPICPQGVYARSKAAAEEAIRRATPDHLIVRTTVVFGWDRASRNFAMQVWQRLSAGERMRVPSDQIGNPTLADFLAEASVQLARRDVREIVNVVGRDRVPRTEFAVRLARRLGLDPDLIDSVTTAELGQIAPRPLNAGLHTDKVTSILGAPAMGIDEALDRFVQQKDAAGRP